MNDLFKNPHFDGKEYIKELDQKRLTGQLKDIYNLMIDGKWRTLSEIRETLNYPESSISAQLRHLRKDRFGNHVVNKRRRGERKNGLFEYQLLKPAEKD